MKRRKLIALMLLPVGIFLGLTWLWQKEDAPVQTIMSDWKGSLIIEEKHHRLHITMTGRVMQASINHPVRIPLVEQGNVIRNITINGKKATPVEHNKWLTLEFSRRNDFVIEADLLITPKHDLGEYNLKFLKPPCTSSILSVQAERNMEFTVKGLTERIVGIPNEGTLGSFVLGRQNEVELSWHETREVNVQPGTASVTPSIAWTIDESTLQANANLAVNIVGGALDRLILQLPENTDNINISGRPVRDFRIDGNTTTVFFRGMLKGHTQIHASFTVKRKKGDIVQFPTLQVMNGRTEAGGFEMILCDAQGVLLEHETEGFRHVSDLDVKPELLGLAKGKPLYIYKRTARSTSMALDLVTSSPFPIVETIADEADVFCVTRANGEEITRIRYMVRNNSKQFLEVIMPEGADLLSVEVENKPCTVSGESRRIMLPLARSVQTLSGLVPFPVEIVFCRQGKPLKKGESRVIDLPELSDIPVASIKAEVMFPNSMEINTWVSTLQKVDAFKHPEGFWQDAPTGKDALAWNYYNAGYDAYRKNDLEQAEEFLAKAADLAGDNNIGRQAKDLDDNIRAGRGEMKQKGGRMERAKVSSIQQALSYQNTTLNAQQESLIDLGLKSISAGDEEMGAELLGQAQQIESELIQRNASKRRQDTISKKYKGKLNAIQYEQERKQKLEKQLASIQKKNDFIANSAGKNKSNRRKAAVLAAELAKESHGLTQSEVQKSAFSANWTADIQPKKSQVSQKVYASRTRKQVLNSGKIKRYSRQGSAKKNISLKEQNRKLQQKVNKLQDALQIAEQGQQADFQQMDDSQLADVLNETVRIENNIDTVITNLLAWQTSQSNIYDIAAKEQLVNMENWATANSFTYGNLSDKTEKRFSQVLSKIKTAKQQLIQSRTKRENAPEIFINIQDIVNDNAPAQQAAFQTFISTNYLAQQVGDTRNFSFKNGTLEIPNKDKNPELLNNILTEFRNNGGNVVSLASRIAKVTKKDLPGIRASLKSKTSDGRQFGVLDEAEYRTLVQGAASLANNTDTLSKMDKKSVIVGTYNNLSGEKLKVSSSDADNNVISIGNQPVELEHDKYLVIDNGDSLSIIKAGAAHDWQEQGQEVTLALNIPQKIAIPRTGNSLKFEKILLGAGESADITLVF